MGVKAKTTTQSNRVITIWRNIRPGRILYTLIIYSVLIALSLLFLFPFAWMILSALKSQYQIYLWPPKWIPDPFMWENFKEVFNNPYLPFDTFIKNTMILEVGIISGRLISCTLIAYAFARLDAPGKNVLFGILMLTLMIPNAILRIPTFILFTKFGWINSFKPLIVPAWFGEAYAIFLMRQFFRTIPKELEEAALVDGASRLSIIFRIIVPLSVPVLTVIAILSFKDIWNDFMGPLLYLNETSKYTVSIGLAYLNGQYDVKMNLLMAASVTLMLPTLILFFIAQRAFVEGISMTGLKG
ncbi:MAG TPA: carbohydrate ABC transporter permease [Aggregatilineaceae bacterium]|nr:carbohydrate ABC transporter permease [Aggregatilineaceae bacterium]